MTWSGRNCTGHCSDARSGGCSVGPSLARWRSCAVWRQTWWPRWPPDATFAPAGWRALRVADTDDEARRTTAADTAVELRETKGEATLLLVDTGRAGAGMDGIYSATREVGEAELFTEAERLAGAEVTSRLSSAHRAYAQRAIRRAQGAGRHDSVSPWAEFDFLCRAAAHRRHPGEYLHLLGLWPGRAVGRRRRRCGTGRVAPVRGSPARRRRRRPHRPRSHRVAPDRRGRRAAP